MIKYNSDKRFINEQTKQIWLAKFETYVYLNLSLKCTLLSGVSFSLVVALTFEVDLRRNSSGFLVSQQRAERYCRLPRLLLRFRLW